MAPWRLAQSYSKRQLVRAAAVCMHERSRPKVGCLTSSAPIKTCMWSHRKIMLYGGERCSPGRSSLPKSLRGRRCPCVWRDSAIFAVKRSLDISLVFSFDLALLLLLLVSSSPSHNMHRQGTNASTESEKARRRHGQSIVFVRLNQSLSIVDNEELSHVSQGLLRSILNGKFHVLTKDRVPGKLSIASAMEDHEDDTTTKIRTS